MLPELAQEREMISMRSNETELLPDLDDLMANGSMALPRVGVAKKNPKKRV